MEYILIGLLVIIIIGMAGLLFVINARMSELRQRSSVDLLKTDVVELGRTVVRHHLARSKDGLQRVIGAQQHASTNVGA